MNTLKTAKRLREFWRQDLGLLAHGQLESLQDFFQGIQKDPSAMMENVLLELDEIGSDDDGLVLLGRSVVWDLVPYAIASDVLSFDPYNGMMFDEIVDSLSEDVFRDPVSFSIGTKEYIAECDGADSDPYAQRLLRWADILELFDVMRRDICVMAEHGDSDDSLLVELITADPEIRHEYREAFCGE